mmetsp:Transcript_13595/g.42923  ORF Transcript_13595/g.42923 Transcript_13595/m.42923 type:complete len:156 (+) Transcript_13595:96-563(+)
MQPQEMVVNVEEVRTELPVNPTGGEEVQPRIPIPVAYNPLAGGEVEDIAPTGEAPVFREVLNEANRVAARRARQEARQVEWAQRRAQHVDASDLTSPPVVYATGYDPPLAVAAEDLAKPPSAPPARADSQNEGYQIGEYDVANYEIREYKSIYDS